MTVSANVHITLSAIRDMAAVEADWRGLEAEAQPSFFQSWTWVGCLVEERFPQPVLLKAVRDGRTVAMGLLNRTPGPLGSECLRLNESGNLALDAVYVEHNGLLFARDATDLLPACLHALLAVPIAPETRIRGPLGRRLRLSGVDSAHMAAARQVGVVHLWEESVAPFVDLRALSAEPDGYLASLSANTRYQIRRSNLRFGRLGSLDVRQANTVAEGLGFLDALAALHQSTWVARGRQGAFANPDFLRFHRTLVGRALPRDEVVLLRIAAGSHVIGYLYNFRLGGRVFNYQSGFDYPAAAALASSHAKPGFTCHHAAILRAQADAATTYDFLAGADQYKSSLTRAATPLFWMDVALRHSGQAFILWMKEIARARARGDTQASK